MRLSDAMTKVSKLLGNLGPADKSTNFILEQRSLMKAQAEEGRPIRDLLDTLLVDGLEYVRMKETIAETRQRVHCLLYNSDVESQEEEHLSKRTFPSDQTLEARQKEN